MKRAKVLAGDLGALKQLKRELDQRQQVAAARRVAQQESARLRDIQRMAFNEAVGPVQPIKTPSRADPAPTLPPPVPTQRQRDEKMVVHEALSDEWDAASLLYSDESLSFRRPGVGLDVLRKLRQGAWSVQAQLDLHHLRTDQAREALSHFIREAHQQGLRCVRVVHGKGLGSPGKVPVLRPKVQSWLIQKNQVMAFVQAGAAHGGAGAVVVLLQGHRR